MSYVKILAVRSNGDVVTFGTAKNNHGFAPLVWEKLAKKYKVPRSGSYLMMDDVALRALWDMFDGDKLSELDKLLLGATFDRVWVKRETIPKLVEACRAFHKEYVADNNLVATVDATADKLEELLEAQPDALGVAFNMCSAIDSFWDWEDEETGAVTNYNVLTNKCHPCTGKRHWEISDCDPEDTPSG